MRSIHTPGLFGPPGYLDSPAATPGRTRRQTRSMPEYFLIASAAGLLFVLNAVRTTRFPLIVVPAFFASWLTIELAPHLLVIHIVGVGFFLARGAAAEWPGWIALGLSAVSGWLLWRLVRESYRVHEVLDEQLSSVIGPA